MTVRQPRYSGDEIARRGRDTYQRQVRPLVEEGNTGRIVALDVDTGEFEVADKIVDATDLLRARLPDAQIWLERVGHEVVDRFSRPIGRRRG
jgi:hypothetical protein